jgi:hypothetical protein
VNLIVKGMEMFKILLQLAAWLRHCIKEELRRKNADKIIENVT